MNCHGRLSNVGMVTPHFKEVIIYDDANQDNQDKTPKPNIIHESCKEGIRHTLNFRTPETFTVIYLKV